MYNTLRPGCQAESAAELGRVLRLTPVKMEGTPMGCIPAQPETTGNGPRTTDVYGVYLNTVPQP